MILKHLLNIYSTSFSLPEKNINEIYPNKGESKKDFIARFMSVTKDEYPDVKQRYAVANSYWDRRNKKELKEAVTSAPDHFLPQEAEKQTFYKIMIGSRDSFVAVFNPKSEWISNEFPFHIKIGNAQGDASQKSFFFISKEDGEKFAKEYISSQRWWNDPSLRVVQSKNGTPYPMVRIDNGSDIPIYSRLAAAEKAVKGNSIIADRINAMSVYDNSTIEDKIEDVAHDIEHDLIYNYLCQGKRENNPYKGSSGILLRYNFDANLFNDKKCLSHIAIRLISVSNIAFDDRVKLSLGLSAIEDMNHQLVDFQSKITDLLRSYEIEIDLSNYNLPLNIHDELIKLLLNEFKQYFTFTNIEKADDDLGVDAILSDEFKLADLKVCIRVYPHSNSMRIYYKPLSYFGQTGELFKDVIQEVHAEDFFDYRMDTLWSKSLYLDIVKEFSLMEYDKQIMDAFIKENNAAIRSYYDKVIESQKKAVQIKNIVKQGIQKFDQIASRIDIGKLVENAVKKLTDNSDFMELDIDEEEGT